MQRGFFFGLAASLVLAAMPAFPQDGTQDLTSLAVELGKFAVVVLVLESAMSSVFDWRAYRAALFNHRALKLPIMLAVGLLVVWGFNYDLFATVMRLVGAAGESNLLTQVISALIIAGGSSGINTLFQNLCLRSVLPDTPPRPVLAHNEAWISVRVNGGAPGDSFHVATAQVATAQVATPAGPELAGSIEVKRFGVRLREALRSDAMRFPNYGRWSLKASQRYRIEVVDTRVVGAVPKLAYEGSFAPRAIIDFQVSV